MLSNDKQGITANRQSRKGHYKISSQVIKNRPTTNIPHNKANSDSYKEQ